MSQTLQSTEHTVSKTHFSFFYVHDEAQNLLYCLSTKTFELNTTYS